MKLKPLSLLALTLVGQLLQRTTSYTAFAEHDNEFVEEASSHDAGNRPSKFGKEWEGRSRGAASVKPLHPHVSPGDGSGEDMGGVDHTHGCKHLDVGDELVYTQLEAEGSNNDLLKKVNGIINRQLEGVTSVSVVLHGEGINRRVGKFKAKAVITLRSASGADVQQCFLIPYEIRDVNECLLPVGHSMRHKCHSSTLCINTSGSYDCGCADGSWGEEGSGSPSIDRPFRSEGGGCGGETSTDSCCGIYGERKERKEACRQDFRCTHDPCKGHTCDERSWCRAGMGYGDYTCDCKDGFKKNERGNCVTDVRVAVSYCEDNTCPYPCRCKAENEGYRCEPPPGYKAYEDNETLPSDYFRTSATGKRLDKIVRCVDKRTPDINIKGPSPITYRQGDTYEELGVVVTDKNEDDSTRTVKIEYSEPFGAYFRSTGEYTVRYSLENELLSGGHISKTRYVHVIDVDECTYRGRHSEFKHTCAPEATCRNTVGGYECRCADGYNGDGLASGSGCEDVTPPIITCVGPGCIPAKFRACNCVGMVSDDGTKRYLPKSLDDSAIEANIKLLKGDICGLGTETDEEGAADMQGLENVAAVSGSSQEDRQWRPERCFSAIDVQFGGKVVDLSKNITKGDLEKDPESERRWRVPHHVQDAAGNYASTAYFYIEVEEVDVLSTIYNTAETLWRDGLERQALWIALCIMGMILLCPWVGQVANGFRVVLAAATVLFFPYSMMNSREDFELGYGFLLRVRAMWMGSEIDRERKIAAYWAQLIDKANLDDVGRDED